MNKLGQISLSSKLLVITISLINVIISGFSDVAAARVSAPSSRSRVTAMLLRGLKVLIFH